MYAKITKHINSALFLVLLIAGTGFYFSTPPSQEEGFVISNNGVLRASDFGWEKTLVQVRVPDDKWLKISRKSSVFPMVKYKLIKPESGEFEFSILKSSLPSFEPNSKPSTISDTFGVEKFEEFAESTNQNYAKFANDENVKIILSCTDSEDKETFNLEWNVEICNPTDAIELFPELDSMKENDSFIFESTKFLKQDQN